jgi:putative membrane protein
MKHIAIAAGSLAGALLAIATPSASPAGSVSAQDANYLQTAISGDRFEIIGGKLAVDKGTTAAVRALGRRLIKDHSKSLVEAVAEAKEDGIKVPTAPTPSMVWELNTIRGFSGTSFDRAYTSLEVKDHQQDIEETTFEVAHGNDPTIRRSAKKELPMLRMHLALAAKAAR